jgi:hypothetical protein
MKSWFFAATLISGLFIATSGLAQISSPGPPASENPPAATSTEITPKTAMAGPGTGAASVPAAPPVQPQGGGIIDGNDPLLQPPPLPPGKPTLVGGSVAKIDRIKQEISLKPFGGGSMKVFFDERTHIYRDGVETTQLGIHKGDRVYVDTLSDGGHVLAKSIRVQTAMQSADARGQLMGYRDGQIQMRDELTSLPISFDVTGNTIIRRGKAAGSSSDLLPNSLVEVRFAPKSADHGVAREIIVLASPGSKFTFAGKVTHVDMSAGVVALTNRSDNRSYEVAFNPAIREYENIGVGTDVTITATFDGARYNAQSLAITRGGDN